MLSPNTLGGSNEAQQAIARRLSPTVDTDDLVDAQGVADILGLAFRNAVSEYQRRYHDMPRPVVDLGAGKPRLWSRKAIVAWAQEKGRIS